MVTSEDILRAIATVQKLKAPTGVPKRMVVTREMYEAMKNVLENQEKEFTIEVDFNGNN